MSPPSSSHLRSSRALAREVPRGTAVDSQLQLGRDLLGISSAFHELTFSRGLLSKNVHPSPASPALVPRERKNCVVHNAAPVTPLPSMHRPPPPTHTWAARPGQIFPHVGTHKQAAGGSNLVKERWFGPNCKNEHSGGRL